MKMKKTHIITISAITVAALATGTVGASLLWNPKEHTTYAAIRNEAMDTTKLENSLLHLDYKAGKEETVYALTDNSGKVNKIIVSDWLKNTEGAATLSDVTNLDEISNVKGEEDFITGENGAIVWNANGKDIYYQGTSQSTLPVNVSIRYQLDGKEITPDMLKGQSGKVTITFTYTNSQIVNVDVDGTEESVFVPFVAASGLVLDNDNFRNINVENGQLINDGSKSAVIGLGFPGLAENLNLSDKTIAIPSSFTITADVTDFQPLTVMTLVSAEAFEYLNLDDVKNADSLKESINQLSDASNQLVAGTSDLYDGLALLMDKSGMLIDGIKQLDEGAKQLDAGITAAKDGATGLESGVKSINGALSTITKNNDALTEGVNQIFESIINTANQQLAAAGLTVPALTTENYSDVLTQLITQLSSMDTEAAAVKQNIAVLQGLKAQLDSVNTFYNGVISYTQGVSQVSEGSSKLSNGATTLKQGLTQLQTGADALSQGLTSLLDNSSSLVDGVSQLSAGALTLRDGMKEFDQNGIDTLVALLDGDMNELLVKAKAMVIAAKEYQSFSAKADDVNGSVRFIIKSE